MARPRSTPTGWWELSLKRGVLKQSHHSPLTPGKGEVTSLILQCHCQKWDFYPRSGTYICPHEFIIHYVIRLWSRYWLSPPTPSTFVPVNLTVGLQASPHFPGDPTSPGNTVNFAEGLPASRIPWSNHPSIHPSPEQPHRVAHVEGNSIINWDNNLSNWSWWLWNWGSCWKHLIVSFAPGILTSVVRVFQSVLTWARYCPHFQPWFAVPLSTPKGNFAYTI